MRGLVEFVPKGVGKNSELSMDVLRSQTRTITARRNTES